MELSESLGFEELSKLSIKDESRNLRAEVLTGGTLRVTRFRGTLEVFDWKMNP